MLFIFYVDDILMYLWFFLVILSVSSQLLLQYMVKVCVTLQLFKQSTAAAHPLYNLLREEARRKTSENEEGKNKVTERNWERQEREREKGKRVIKVKRGEKMLSQDRREKDEKRKRKLDEMNSSCCLTSLFSISEETQYFLTSQSVSRIKPRH